MTTPFIVHGIGGDGKQTVRTVAEAAAVVRSIALSTNKRVFIYQKPLYVGPSALFSHENGQWTCEGKAEWAEKILAILRRHG